MIHASSQYVSNPLRVYEPESHMYTNTGSPMSNGIYSAVTESMPRNYKTITDIGENISRVKHTWTTLEHGKYLNRRSI